MSEVQRFDFGARDADGTTPLYVRASDYQALEADNADNVRRMADDANRLADALMRIAALEAELADMTRAFARRGGKVKSPAKTATARENGKRGGRPRLKA
jgi:hypothetical protein